MVERSRAQASSIHRKYEVLKVRLGTKTTLSRYVQPANATEGVRQAAEKFSSGVEGMGAAFREPFSRQRDLRGGGEYRGSGGYTAAAVQALRAAPGGIGRGLSGSEPLLRPYHSPLDLFGSRCPCQALQQQLTIFPYLYPRCTHRM